MNTVRKTTSVLLLTSVLMWGSGALPAARAGVKPGITITEVADSAFPKVTIYATVLGEAGVPVAGLPTTACELFEDKLPVADFAVSTAQNAGLPLTLALVVDASGSMEAAAGNGQNAFQALQAAVTELTNQLAAPDRVALFTFNSEVTLAQPFTTDKTLVNAALAKVSPQGGTRLYDAVEQGLRALAAAPGDHKALIVVTDGKDGEGGKAVSTATLQTVLQSTAELGLAIFPVGFGEVNKDELGQLATKSGGQLVITDASALKSSLAGVIQMLQMQYVVSFTSAIAVDGNPHDLRLVVEVSGEKSEATRQFNAKSADLTVALPGLAANQTVTGSVKLAPEIVARGALAGVDYLLDGKPLATATAAPYAIAWDTATVAPGDHTVEIIARDANGNSGRLSIVLKVAPSKLTVNLDGIKDGAKLSGEVQIAPAIYGPLPIATVSILVDGEVLADPTNAPYTFSWDTAAVAVGKHSLKIVVADSAGTVQLERTIEIVRALEIRFITPIEKQALVGLVPLEVEVNGVANIERVDFVVDGTAIGTVDKKPFRLEWDSSSAGPGKHTLSASVVDNTSRTAKTEVQVSVQVGLNWGLGLVAGILILALAGVVFAVNRARRKPSAARLPPGAPPMVQPPGSAARAAPAYYVFIRSSGGQQQWPLTGTFVTVGRNSNNTIVLGEPDVSREHGVFELDNGGWAYRDLAASTASLYNGTDLYGSARLSPGDVLTIGSLELEFGHQ